MGNTSTETSIAENQAVCIIDSRVGGHWVFIVAHCGSLGLGVIRGHWALILGHWSLGVYCESLGLIRGHWVLIIDLLGTFYAYYQT